MDAAARRCNGRMRKENSRYDSTRKVRKLYSRFGKEQWFSLEKIYSWLYPFYRAQLVKIMTIVRGDPSSSRQHQYQRH
jgi:hypothetical protein